MRLLDGVTLAAPCTPMKRRDFSSIACRHPRRCLVLWEPNPSRSIYIAGIIASINAIYPADLVPVVDETARTGNRLEVIGTDPDSNFPVADRVRDDHSAADA